MPRTPLALVLAAGALAVAPGAAVAAPESPDCRTPDLVTATDRADTVFLGRVVDSGTRTERGEGQDAGRRQVWDYEVQPERVYRGRITTSPVQVTAADRTGLEDIPNGQRWVFLVQGAGGELTVEPCSWSREATQSVLNRVEGELGNGRAYVETPPEPEPLAYRALGASQPLPLGRLVAPGAAVTLVGLLGLVLLRRRPH